MRGRELVHIERFAIGRPIPMEAGAVPGGASSLDISDGVSGRIDGTALLPTGTAVDQNRQEKKD
jgi:hypothetical protein